MIPLLYMNVTNEFKLKKKENYYVNQFDYYLCLIIHICPTNLKEIYNLHSYIYKIVLSIDNKKKIV